ncbi:transcription activator [Fusarium heterosporum]|uniref:Transcription activator n=1 Tax=Fusarium heterosporum TaxID=42747 RepID=A0A8H5T4A7_FUSHE|nr:transcription activator [Fusarium heterosporum]
MPRPEDQVFWLAAVSTWFQEGISTNSKRAASLSKSPQIEYAVLSSGSHGVSEPSVKTSMSISPNDPAETQSFQPKGESKTPLINPLAFHTYDFIPGLTGQLVFMGTSSNWSFNKRVLNMTHERVKGTPLPNHNLHFAGLEGKVFDLKWDGTRKLTPQDVPDMSALPTKDFALYLINSVKFHCSWLYNLFDEDTFIERFHHFHENPTVYTRSEPLWLVHYLLVLALGKAFVVQSTKSRRPPGGDFFIQAMKLMPDFSFFEPCPTRSSFIQVCSALRHGLDHGIHTEMQSIALDREHVQRSHHMFWTVYILERQMGSLLGVPLGQPQKLEALKVHVEFCRVLAKIDRTVYGLEGKLDSRYLGATQEVLKSIATVTERLNRSFEIQTSEGMAGISRISAHLHLLQHQSESVKGLVQMCTESAQQILRIISSLSEQGLLETFLRFDQDAAFTATIALLMAAAIDSSLLPDHTPWTQRAYALFDEMNSRGNLVANMVASELKQLEGLLREFLVNGDSRSLVPTQETNTPREGLTDDMETVTEESGYAEPFNLDSGDEFGLGLNYELSAEQLLNIANSLDIDSLTWPWPEDPMAENLEGI